MNGEVEQGIERFGGVLEWRPRPTPGCSAEEEEEALVNEVARHVDFHNPKFFVVAIQVSFEFLARLMWIDIVLQSRVKVT
jgi:hypothetical protein